MNLKGAEVYGNAELLPYVESNEVRLFEWQGLHRIRIRFLIGSCSFGQREPRMIAVNVNKNYLEIIEEFIIPYYPTRHISFILAASGCHLSHTPEVNLLHVLGRSMMDIGKSLSTHSECQSRVTTELVEVCPGLVVFRNEFLEIV